MLDRCSELRIAKHLDVIIFNRVFVILQWLCGIIADTLLDVSYFSAHLDLKCILEILAVDDIIVSSHRLPGKFKDVLYLMFSLGSPFYYAGTTNKGTG